MNLFYSPEINQQTVHFNLSEEESAHVVRVLRMKKGDKFFLTDGKGMFYELEITDPRAKKCETKVIRSFQSSNHPTFHLSIAIAPTKNIDRFEWFLEKATEIGCSEIIPIRCKHSERTVIKTERLNKVMVSAMKQCLKAELPILHELVHFEEFLSSLPDRVAEQRFIGHIPELDETSFPPANPQGNPLSKCIRPVPGSHILIAIGPEGGFSEKEVSFAVKQGFTMVSMGNSRLRVETAGITACATVGAVFQQTSV